MVIRSVPDSVRLILGRTEWPGLTAIIDTESYRDLQESYRAYNFFSELEIRMVRVLSRPYNQGTYGRCAGMARRPLTVWLVPCSNNSLPIWTALFSPVGPAHILGRLGRKIASLARVLLLCSPDFNFSHSFRHVLSTIGGISARSWDAQSSYAHQTAAQCWGLSLQSGCRKFGMSAPNCFRS